MKRTNATWLRLSALLLAVLCLWGCSSQEAEQTGPAPTAGQETEEGVTPLSLPDSLAEADSVPETQLAAGALQEPLYACIPVEEGDATLDAKSSAIDQTRLSYNVGNCKALEGKPYVLAIFLDDDVSHWSEEEVLRYWRDLIDPGLTFLEENAALWGAELEFQKGYYASYGHPDRPVKYDGVISTFMDGVTTEDVLEQAAASLGFSSKEHMHEHLQAYSGQDQIAYLIMLNKGGRSYSRPYRNRSNTQSAENYYMEYCMIYTGFYDDSYDTASDTIAHEMLHLFGAEDFYAMENRKKLAAELYPKDIMLCAMPDLEYFDLGDFTAYTVGWTDEVPAVCGNENWWS